MSFFHSLKLKLEILFKGDKYLLLEPTDVSCCTYFVSNIIEMLSGRRVSPPYTAILKSLKWSNFKQVSLCSYMTSINNLNIFGILHIIKKWIGCGRSYNYLIWHYLFHNIILPMKPADSLLFKKKGCKSQSTTFGHDFKRHYVAEFTCMPCFSSGSEFI